MKKIIADIGGTNARFSIVNDNELLDTKVLTCLDYPSLADAAQAYLKDTGHKPEAGAFAVATPVDGSDRVVMTNHVWDFSIEETRKSIGLEQLKIINDFAALAYAVPHLTAKDVVQIGAGEPQKNMPIGIIGPGSGLGVSAVVFSEGKPVPVATEGGHVTMPATTEREFSLFEYLRKTKYHHVSAERVLSGKGLVNICNAISGVDGVPLPERTPEDITKAALDKSCPVCEEALDLFCHFLGVIAGNLALTLGAKGGIYLAGGIVPQLSPYLIESRFRHSFLAKGRFKEYVSEIPTYMITHPFPGLEGLKYI